MGFSKRRWSYHVGKMRSLQPQNFQDLTTDGERSSVRSSEDGQSTSPGGDERQNLIRKMDQLREKLKEVSLQREGDVEEFLALTKETEAQRGADNPQMTRIKQNFEKKNKRHTHDTDYLQKKLNSYEARLIALENGYSLDTSGRSNVISTVGQGIRRTGANIKGMTETVMAAPMELANKIKNTFGSADNVNEGDDSRVGLSTFYSDSENGAATTSAHKPPKSSTLPPGLKMELGATLSNPNRPNISADEQNISRLSDPSFSLLEPLTSTPNPLESSQLTEEFRKFRKHLQKIEDKCDHISTSLKSEIVDLNRTLDEERFKSKKLEDLLNETIELNQAEFLSLKQEQKSLANRLDYQYNDRFRTVEENVEAVKNQIVRMENSIKQTLDLRLGGTGGNTVLLSGVNILLELLKIFLYVIATVLDLFRPFTGSRNKAGALLFVVISLFVFFNYVDVFSLISRRNTTTATETTLPVNPEL